MSQDEFSLAVSRNAKRLLRADSDRKSDHVLEILFSTIEHKARRDLDSRIAFANPSYFEFIEDPVVEPLLETFGYGVAKWYQSDFPAAAQCFAELGQQVESNIRTRCPPFVRTAIALSALSRQAACCTRQGSKTLIQASRDLVRQAEERIGDEDRPNCVGWLRFEQGRLAFWADDVEAARRYFTQADGYFTEINNRFGRGKVAGALARLNTHEGLYEAALDQLVWLRAWQDDGDRLSQAQTLYRSGRVWRYREDYDRAIEALTQALTLIEAVDNTRWESHIRDVLGDVYLLKGDLKSAEREYTNPVLTKSDDPVIQARNSYRASKLKFAQLCDADAPIRADWQSLIDECEELAQGDHTQMIPEKAQLLLGQIQARQKKYEEAADTFSRAATGFSRGQAGWYYAIALYLQGQALLAANEIPHAAQVMMAGLDRAVDRIQQERFRASLENDFQQLDPAAVCQCIASLQEKVFRSAENSVIVERGTTHLHAMLADLNSRYLNPPALLLHIDKELNQLDLLHLIERLAEAGRLELPDEMIEPISKYWSLDRAKHLLLNPAARQQEEFDLLGIACGESRAAVTFAREHARLLHIANTNRHDTEWIQVADLIADLELTDLNPTEAASLSRPPLYGTLAERDEIVHSLKTLQEFMQEWTQMMHCNVHLKRSKRILQFQFFGSRDNVPHDKLSELLSRGLKSRDLIECGLDAMTWAHLVAATLPIKAIGGHVQIRPDNEGLQSPANYCLDVSLPAELLPPWASTTDTAASQT